jgi:ABC-type glutathione transport system ATPase component
MIGDVAEETAEPGFTIYALHGADRPRSARELPRLIVAPTSRSGSGKRLALARVFFRDAPFVILDEPRSADEIYVLQEGRLVESGTHEELVADGARYAELFELQAAAYR